ncbi:MAG: hypothetical protein M1517_04370 [Deltaproteobacteria bacterium]|nr:hypothetical protein [Deltaproteobacteria bacterium]
MRSISIERIRRSAGVIVCAMTIAAGTVGLARAWETTEFWTPCVEDVHPYGVPELMIGNFFSVEKSVMNSSTTSPSDLGFEIGVLPYDKIQMEVGIDAMYPTPNPYMFNAKIGTPEDSAFKGSPGMSVGIFGIGTDPATAYDVGDVVIGKTVPYVGRLHAGYYYGNHGALLNSKGQSDNQGWMVAYDRTIWSPGKNWMDSMVLAADYASGDNTVGGGGFGVYLNWTKNISLLIGPTWFNDTGINGSWKWTTQVYINL